MATLIRRAKQLWGQPEKRQKVLRRGWDVGLSEVAVFQCDLLFKTQNTDSTPPPPPNQHGSIAHVSLVPLLHFLF